MRNEFNAFPDTDRTIAMQAAYNLMRETISAAFSSGARATRFCDASK